MRLSDLRQRQRRKIAESELKHTSGKRKQAPIGFHMTQLDEREQDSTTRCPGQARLTSNFAQSHFCIVRVEGADHTKPRVSDCTYCPLGFLEMPTSSTASSFSLVTVMRTPPIAF